MPAESKRLRTALLFQAGNFVGREYFARLVAHGRTPDLVIAVGEMKPKSVAREQQRTGGLWNPPPISRAVETHRFATLADRALVRLLENRLIDVAIQGGVGILKVPVLAAARLGFLNVHPGRLPQYRGNSCPEWAIFNGDEVWATAHMVDTGIDTGPVVHALPYDIDPRWSYHAFRAHLYRHCARVLVEALDRIELAENLAAVLRPQEETAARYWPPMGESEHRQVAALFADAAA